MKLLTFLLIALTADAAALVARVSSGFTTNTTWGVAEAGASATQLTRTSNTDTTTSYVYSSAFTCTNTDVIDGLLLRTKRLNSTGTVSVALSEDNGTTATREVTVNASDLTLTDDTWVFFKFGSTLTCDGGTDYKVGIKGSSASNATFYRDGTAGNWTRILRTAATQVPVAADSFYIAGECTAAATCGVLTVTLDETATTDYGLMDIGQYGVVTAGTTAATNYYLRLSGDLNIWAGGTLSLGTVGTVVPTGSTFKLNFDCGSNVQYGLTVNAQGTFIAQGATKTVKAFLAANAAAAATALTTDISTGWLNGDEIALASTSRTYTESEKKTMGANAAGTAIGTIGALTYAHSGTSPTRAELANLTRNVQVFGASSSLQTYIYIRDTATVDVDYAEFYWMGSGTADKRGLDMRLTTGSVNIQYSSFHDFIQTNSRGAHITSLSTSGSFTLSRNVYALIANSHIIFATTTSSAWTLSDNLCIGSTDGGVPMVELQDIGGTFTDNTLTGSAGAGLTLFEDNATMGTYSGITIHSGNQSGFRIYYLPEGSGTFSNITAWRNGGTGFQIENVTVKRLALTIDGYTGFGNGSYNFDSSTNRLVSLVANNWLLSGDSSFSTAYGAAFSGADQVVLNNSSFGVTSGIKVAHTSSDLYAGSQSVVNVVGSNNIFASTNNITTHGGATRFVLGVNKYGGVSGDNRTYILAGNSIFNVLRTDTVIFNTASPSDRMTPVATTYKFPSSLKTVALNSGATTAFSVWVRKSISTDAGGANYNGAQPRLMIQTNPSAGIGTGATDVVCDTMTAAVGTWEQLSCTTGTVSEDTILAAYVDCDGTAGWINVDDWGVTNPQAVGAEKYWWNGGTNLTISGNGAAAAATLAYPMIQ